MTRDAVRVASAVAMSLGARGLDAQAPGERPTGVRPPAGGALRVPAALTGEARRLDSLGLEAWRAYEMVAHGASIQDPRDATAIEMARGAPMQFDQATIALVEGGMRSKPRNKQAQALRELARFFKPAPGEGSYRSALQHFTDALAADSESVDIRRHLYRAFAARNDWQALQAQAERALRAPTADANDWLARGLAQHRLENYSGAADAFQRAFALFPDDQRAMYGSASRLLTPNAYANSSRFPDSLRFARLDTAERERLERLFWTLADPRPATPINEGRLEYFARLAYADFRWSDGSPQRGTDTDQGDIHIRFGPPDLIYGIGQMLIWTYRDNSIFYFGRFPGYLRSQVSFAERRVVEDSILIERPVSWANMPIVRGTSPMLSRVARFRGNADSADAVVTAAIPVRSLLKDAQLAGQLPIDVHMHLSDPAARVVGSEDRRTEVSRDSLPAGINGSWVRRVGEGAHVALVGAELRDVGRYSASSVEFIVDSLSGFGVSDVLLGASRGLAGAPTPARWHEAQIAPTVGVTPYSQPLAVVWETYELAKREGRVEYEVSLEIERTFKHNLAGFSARIARNLMNVIAQNGSATGKVAVRFTESRVAADVVTNALTVDLKGSVTGPYRLTISVKDTRTGLVARRSANFVLSPD